jgi:hypothetical protein
MFTKQKQMIRFDSRFPNQDTARHKSAERECKSPEVRHHAEVVDHNWAREWGSHQGRDP